MTIISLSFREESENTTHDNSDNINVTNVSDTSNNEVRETTTETSITVEELRNYDTHESATIEVLNFEDLKLAVNDLVTNELATQSKLDELITLQQYNNTIIINIVIGAVTLIVISLFYKFLMIGFYKY